MLFYSLNNILLPPANVVCEGYVFTPVCDSVNRGGMHGCSGGACVVAPGGDACFLLGGHAWLLPGGHAWLLWGGMHGEAGGHVLQRGACVVKGGMHGLKGGVHGGGHTWQRGACMAGGHAWQKGGHVWYAIPPRYGRSLRGRYASYWNAFLY